MDRVARDGGGRTRRLVLTPDPHWASLRGADSVAMLSGMAKTPAHKLNFDGTNERDLMGRCSCDTVILQQGLGTARQQIRRAHAVHVANMERAARLAAGLWP